MNVHCKTGQEDSRKSLFNILLNSNFFSSDINDASYRDCKNKIYFIIIAEIINI